MRVRNAVVVVAWLLLGGGGAGAQEAKLIYTYDLDLVNGMEGDYQTLTCDPDGGNVAKFTLTLPKRFENKSCSPIRSPDGKKIAFYGYPDKGAAFFVANADGTNVKRLATGSFTRNLYHLHWFPDSKHLVYEEDNVENSSPRIWVVNADGSAPAALTPENVKCQSPSVSPDGKRIALVRGKEYYRGGSPNAPPGAVAVMDADGQNLKPVHRLQKHFDSGNVAWSPDGKRLLFNDAGDLYVMNPDGSDVKQLTRLGGIDNFSTFAWSPDGKLVTFSRIQDGSSENRDRSPERVRYDLYVMRADGSNAKAVVKDFKVAPPIDLGWWTP